MKMVVGKIFALDEDYQEPFLQNGAETHVKYTQLKFSERTIHNSHHTDIYVLEPMRYYYIEFLNDVSKTNYRYSFNSRLFKSGLIIREDFINNRVYVFNASSNLIYIKDKCVVGVIN